MATKTGGAWTRAPESRRFVIAVLAASALVWGCRGADSPTAVRSLDARTANFAAGAGASAQAEVIPGQYIITFTDDVKDIPGVAKGLMAQHGGELGFTYSSALKGFSAKLPAQAVEALQRNPQVARVEQDQVVRTNGSEAGATWGLDRIDQHVLPYDQTYTYANGGEGVSVYILDTGIRPTHSEFAGRASGVYTSISDGRGTTDCNGHGTHVAGTIGGVKYGVAKGVRLYAVRVLDCSGSGTYSGIIAGIDWVTKNRVLPAVANMSLGGGFSSTVNSAVQSSIKAGVVYAVAAGNSSADACSYSPSSTPEAITVGASGNTDGVQSFSNVGSCVDLFAPGQAIRSAYFVDDTSSISMAGTSMASPHVAGVAALYLSANPTATPAQVATAVVGGATMNVLSAVPVGTANRLLYSGVAGASAPTPPPSDTTKPPIIQPVDQPPTASFTSSCPHGKCSFDASASADDHGIVSYAWNFGDASPAVSGSTVKASHTYLVAGTYIVTLTVTDGAGHATSRSATLVFNKL